MPTSLVAMIPLFQNAKIQDLNVIYYRINSKESVL